MTAASYTEADARDAAPFVPMDGTRDEWVRALAAGRAAGLTDDELIDLFKLIENSSSEAKPKAKAKPKTAGIKRPVVAIEKTSDKSSRPASNGKRFTAPGRKKKGR